MRRLDQQIKGTGGQVAVSQRAHRMRWLIAVATTLVCGTAGLLASTAAPAMALSEGPQWTVSSVSRPTNFVRGDATGGDAYMVTVTNTGSAPTDGSAITISDELPQGLSLDPLKEASGEDQLAAVEGNVQGAELTCVLGACTYTGLEHTGSVRCPGGVSRCVFPDETLTVRFPVDVSAGANAVETNVVRVSGGGAPDAAMSTPTAIFATATPASFGISPGGATTALSSTQAGAHPDLTTSIAFNTVNATGSLAGDPKETTDDLPPGFAGDLVDMPSCPVSVFALHECPIGTQIGVTTLTLDEFGTNVLTFVRPVYNLAPGPGELAKLGFFTTVGIPIEGDVTLRPGDYGLRTTFHNANESLVELDNVSLTIWGVPADPIHDALRWKPGEDLGGEFGVASMDLAPVPFLTNPTVCEGVPLRARFTVSSWEQPNVGEGPPATVMPFGPAVGCDRLSMRPSVSVVATSTAVSAASGLDLDMQVPQTYGNAYGLATSTLKRVAVELPEGMTVNPSAGAGLGACTQGQFEAEGVQFETGVGCPSTSKLGEVRILTPALKEEAVGSVFLAEPKANEFGSLLALYIVARIPARGVLVKSAGEVKADPVTGRLSTTFDELPKLPFSDFLFKFRQGATSPLVTPPTCGSYTVQADLTPWSAPLAPPLDPVIPAFEITSGFDGGACPSGGEPSFVPQVSAGTLDNDAGGYSELDLRIARNDGEQEITRFSARLPAGLTANLSGVPYCSDAAIEAAKQRTGAAEESSPSCPAGSLIGHTLVGAGVGSVLAWAPGRVYLAGPYNGAPFSIAAITSAKVGPFDLGTVVVREALKIDPVTAAVTVDAAASDPIPHIIQGIVIHVRDIRVYIDRPSFTLNPTSCAAMSFSATVSGSGAEPADPADEVPVTVSDPFQAADCQALAFKPLFTASTSGKTSRSLGASLSVKLAYPTGPQGSEANIRSVKVELPKQLPSRLKTLQQACVDSVFDANPAGCPAASMVGQAAALTPILPVPLVGPAYFVSHGGAAFPELIVVLQGDGVRVDLHGETDINNKTGVTSSTFSAVPDEPVSSFQLTLPQGPDSALAANANLCSATQTVTSTKRVTRRVHGHTKRVSVKVHKTIPAPLVMPTVFTAQNGLAIHQSTQITITGCAKAKAKAKKKSKSALGKGAPKHKK